MTRPGVSLAFISAVAGACAGVAAFQGGLIIADVVLGILACSLAVFDRRRPHLLALVAGACVAVTALWSAHPIPAALAGYRIVALSIVFTAAMRERRWLAGGMFTALAWQTLWLLFVVDHPRPSGLTDNASVLGQLGLAAFAASSVVPAPGILIAGVTLGVSVARAAIFAAAVMVVTSRSVWLAASFVAVLAFVALQVGLSGGWGRLTPTAVLASLRGRAELAVAASQDSSSEGHTAVVSWAAIQIARAELGEPAKDFGRQEPQVLPSHTEAASKAYPYQPPRYLVWGYGYDSYVDRTGLLRPHVVPLVAVYELGILAIPLGAILIIGLWQTIPWRLALPIAVLWAFTEEHWSTGAGHYMLAVMAAMAIGQATPAGATLQAIWERWGPTAWTRKAVTGAPIK